MNLSNNDPQFMFCPHREKQYFSLSLLITSPSGKDENHAVIAGEFSNARAGCPVIAAAIRAVQDEKHGEAFVRFGVWRNKNIERFFRIEANTLMPDCLNSLRRAPCGHESKKNQQQAEKFLHGSNLRQKMIDGKMKNMKGGCQPSINGIQT